MTEGKMRRLVAAGTAAAIVLLFVLLTVLVCQLCGLSARSKELKRLRAEYARLEESIDDTESEIERMSKDAMREYLAQMYGYVKK